MTKSIVEEALIDAHRLKELAIEQARRQVIEDITPKIKELIESAMNEDSSAEQSGGESDVDSESLDKEVDANESADYALNNETLRTIGPIIQAVGNQASKLEVATAQLGESVQRALRSESKKRQDPEFNSEIAQLFSRLEDMYSHVHESTALTPSRKEALEQKLESHFSELNSEFKEISMKRLSLKEADEMFEAPEDDLAGGEAPAADALPAEGEGAEGKEVVIKLKGLDDVDAEALSVDVEVEAPEEEAGDDLPAPEGDMADDASGEEDMFGEGVELSDDTIIEVSDVEMKKALARMTRLAESDSDVGKTNPKGGKIPVDDFGGGSDDGDPWLDHDVTVGMSHLAGKPGKKLSEADGDDVDESMEVEGDDCVEGDEPGDMAESASVSVIQRKIKEEKVRQLESQKKIAKIRSEARKCAGTVREAKLKSAARAELKRIRESRDAVSTLTSRLNNSKSSNTSIVKQLREKLERLEKSLEEHKLFSAKLLYANKLLQTEGLQVTVALRDKVFGYMDSAENLREVKELYSKLSKKLSARAVNESRNSARASVISGSSKATRTTGTSKAESTLTEGAEPGVALDRWAQLAGIK